MDGRRALAKAFDDWYSTSGMNQSEVAAAGGPSTTTQTLGTQRFRPQRLHPKLRRGRAAFDPISRQTLKQLDEVTGWAAGTAARIYAGVQQSPANGGSANPVDWSQVTNEELAEQVRVRLVVATAREFTVRKGSRQPH